MEIPVKVGDVLKGEIKDLSHEGKGILKVDNFTLFVEGGLIGDIAEVGVINVKKRFGLGKVLNIIEPSKDRINSKCNISNICGGCQFQELQYIKQLQWKKNKVKMDLVKIGGISQVEVNDTLGMEDPLRYRNNVQIPVGFQDNKVVLGFYEKGSYEIANMNKCIIQPEIGDKTAEIIKNWMEKYNIKAYNKVSKKGILRHIGIRTNKDNKAMLILVTAVDKLPYEKELIDMLISNLKDIESIYQNINKMNTSVTYGRSFKKLYGKDKLIDWIGDYRFYISPNSFFQVNRIQSKVLYDKVVEYLDLRKEDTVFDLYCGIGTISLYLAYKAKKVYGVEIIKEAILDAKENAKLNNISNVEFIEGKSEEIFPRLMKKGVKGNKVVLDPPRKGCEKEVLETIIEMVPEKVVYVSCNSTTMARDVAFLVENGYKVEEVQPVDMFPMTSHVECVVLIERG
ncbi:23S rRNA (uracil(1939)-C(5))-methyltransferase RlmD [Tissierella sp. MSJ-40]|uniref:23S rRNA (Uracil(1939)-C(5))-methyltransferase RlmD n=1 Tax=Tissierella simiarum TaxID=2841534 RepID=A0ABS6E605_9FIRM|nr:23S rRNA (uracil(1939)-C(5))-methyltransferase RlmD [Tissierella simiarum]MBU5438359.1 23S rRNA (uracil(1939)-C(5))-methyltransferase RlmD [Tissierella simiarum]